MIILLFAYNLFDNINQIDDELTHKTNNILIPIISNPINFMYIRQLFYKIITDSLYTMMNVLSTVIYPNRLYLLLKL